MTTATVLEIRRNGNPVGDLVDLPRQAAREPAAQPKVIASRRILRSAGHRRRPPAVCQPPHLVQTRSQSSIAGGKSSCGMTRTVLEADDSHCTGAYVEQ